jgi:hypothetical protein
MRGHGCLVTVTHQPVPSRRLKPFDNPRGFFYSPERGSYETISFLGCRSSCVPACCFQKDRCPPFSRYAFLAWRFFDEDPRNLHNFFFWSGYGISPCSLPKKNSSSTGKNLLHEVGIALKWEEKERISPWTRSKQHEKIKTNQGQPKEKMGYEDNETDPLYQQLLNTLKALIEDSDAKTVDLSLRDELSCGGCGAYEDFSLTGQKKVFDEEENPTEHEMFILIDAKQRNYHRGKRNHTLITYTFLCPLCGLYQTAIVQDEWDDV